MKFTNQLGDGYDAKVALYDEKDTWYTVPIIGMEKDVAGGGTITLREDSYPKAKVRVWLIKDLQEIIHPGAIYDMSDDFYIRWTQAKGNFLEKAVLESKNEKYETEKVKLYEFFDLRKFNEVVERTVKTNFQTAFTKSSSYAKTHTEEIELTLGASVGGWIGEKDVEGAKGDISAEFKTKTLNSFTEKYENSISRIWSKSEEVKYKLKPGKIYAFCSHWNIKYAIGTVKYFGEATHYKILDSTESKVTEPQAYDNESQMSEELRKEYKNQLKLNPIKN